MDTPVGALSMLSDLAEIINHLWGQLTPGGRLYPAPLRREVLALAWRPGEFISMLAEHAEFATDRNEGYQYAIVRAVRNGPHTDPGLPMFDARYESTTYPMDPLWGPGTPFRGGGLAGGEPPRAGRVSLPRPAIRAARRRRAGFLPMRPAVAAGLSAKERSGRWYLVRADYPDDAMIHVRALDGGVAGHGKAGPCKACHADTMAIGDYAATIAALNLTAATPPDLCGPLAESRAVPAGW